MVTDPHRADTHAALPDHFDLLPDPILLLILENLRDVKSLGRCSAVSRRFRSLSSLASSVLVRVDSVVSEPPPRPTHPVLSRLTHLLLRPFTTLSHLLRPPPPPKPHYSPSDVLRPFTDLRHLTVELPSAELNLAPSSLLRWSAVFGSTLRRCAILSSDPSHSHPVLKPRVVSTVTSLVAASSRHHLLRPVVAQHPTLQRVELRDRDGQGLLVMGADELREMREGPRAPVAIDRTPVPALRMRMWYAARLEVPGGRVLEGVTLVAILPSKVGDWEDGDDWWVAEGFEEPIATAVRMMMKMEMHSIEMNSF